MSVQLNHTIVWCKDQQRSASFLSEVFGLPPATRYGPFLVVEAANGVSLDYHETDGAIAGQHYAFIVSEPEFDEIFGRITERGIDYWADPMLSTPGEINTTTADAACTSPIPTATCSRRSLARTAAATDHDRSYVSRDGRRRP